MYTIEKKHYGFRITMGGLYAPGEIAKYVEEKDAALHEFEGSYSLMVDLRSAIPPVAEDAELLQQSQVRSKDRLIRQAIVVHSPVVKLRANQLMVSSQIHDRTRFISAAESSNWEELAMNWILYGDEPDPDRQPEVGDRQPSRSGSPG